MVDITDLKSVGCKPLPVQVWPRVPFILSKEMYMFIQTEFTPNPNAIKFFPNISVSPNQPMHFSNLDEAKGKSSLVVQLFNINNVKSVFLGSDFITITKEEESDWLVLKPEILMIIMDHFTSGFTVFDGQNNISTDKSTVNNFEEMSEIEQQIVEIIETRVRPSVAMDGGDIIYRGFENGVVKLELRGACYGCPSSTITLKNGIESMLKHFIPEVESVEAVD
ncbi:NFU1 iron-sulfur cluster scaffold like, mitochondrial [Pseudolycoriella hygida]|uniref:NFU1 iron-sulfur cluster scaffold homolog, mitochondrial n=1 Tax=Pseudolycoriella hygida TaxID=35572 RepID=A0A9Q0N9L6_9DIPT|nr:NFU1 iron-sulfur cluster scaffold like, mitochondrial [Pseudolycoriella hygida]